MNVETFIQRWTAREGGAERANYQMFLSELCDVLEVGRPEPAGAERGHNDYVFERAVRPRESDGSAAPKRIDLYKKDAFILEAKQSRLPGQKNAIPPAASSAIEDLDTLGRRSRGPAWDVMMQNARKQAEGYVFLLDADHPAPPFIITCDVGHCLEIYADFSGAGRAYSQYPDRNGFRIYMDDLRDAKVRKRLAQVWNDPHSLDPSKVSARVTKDIALSLAEVSKGLEARDCNPEDVAHFLMRCLFTMFAEDTGLLPKDSFGNLLARSVDDPEHFPHRLKALWGQMDRGEEFSHVIEARVRHFNGGLFKDTTVFPLVQGEITDLLNASKADWRQVDPAIFGALLEQALDKTERRKLGAHYTPRSYVQRMVEVTVLAPLRADWQAALTRAQQARDEGDPRQAIALVQAFHHQLCMTRVLDPACGTGNFLYVALEMMKQLEGEVLQILSDLGENQSRLAMAGETVDPHQFLGLELNPRAAAIAELVIWIGYLQWHYRNYESHPAEPILRAFNNINFGRRTGYDAVLTWRGWPVPAVVQRDGARLETYPDPARPVWPEAEFIVGNPPFIGGKDLRSRMDPGYAEALWRAHPHMNESADFVMYWWDRAAEILARKDSPTRRFGFVTTNSISQVFQRRVMERHLNAKAPISLVFAVADHPWTLAGKDSAAVRIAMTVAEAGSAEGVYLEVEREQALDADDPVLVFNQKLGRINSDLTVGSDITRANKLISNTGVAHDGVKLHGAGFIVTRDQAENLGLGSIYGIDKYIREYRNGRDLVAKSRNLFVIDLWGVDQFYIRTTYPYLYQHILEHVKPERDRNNRQSYRDNWWIFGEPRRDLRPALEGMSRFIATVDTARHRIFQFIPATFILDDKSVIVAEDSADILAILTSRVHCIWALRAGGWLGQGNDSVYTKTRTFDPFPFPERNNGLSDRLGRLAEELDATRKLVLAEHGDLNLTGLYNLLEKLRSGVSLTRAEEDAVSRGRVLILQDLHDQIDALTAQAYGWPVDLNDEQILERLVALNAARAAEEAGGHVRWLRPEYQEPRFGKALTAKSGELALNATETATHKALPAFPTSRYEQPLAIESLLAAADRPLTAAELSRGFKRGGKRIERRIEEVLVTLERYGRVTPSAEGRFRVVRAA